MRSWFAPCRTARSERSPGEDAGLAARPSPSMALCFGTCCSPLCKTSMGPSRSSRMSPLHRLSWWQSMSRCVLLAVSQPTHCPCTRPADLEKNSEHSTRGRHWLRKLDVTLVPIGVQAGHQNPAQVVLKIQVKRLFTELGGRLKETGERCGGLRN